MSSEVPLQLKPLVEFQAVMKVLNEDAELHRRQAKAPGDVQTERRSFVRSAFAFVEGVAFGLKQIALTYRTTFFADLSEDELRFVHERGVELNDQGELEERRISLRTLPNIRFAFKVFAKASRLDFSLPVHEDGWERLTRARGIRDRLTHPKSSADLNVSDEELEIVEIAFDWFGKQLGLLIQRAAVLSLAALNDWSSKLKNRDSLPKGKDGGYSAEGLQEILQDCFASPSAESRREAEITVQKLFE